jgi:SRSO17 transposase
MSEERQECFGAYVEVLAEVIGHADRAAPLRDYYLGLLLPRERKRPAAKFAFALH